MVTILDFGKLATLVVEDVDCRFLARLQSDLAAMAAGGLFFDEAKRGEGRG